MATTIRVILRVLQGEPWRRMSAEEREEQDKRRDELFEAWKADPGTSFVSYCGTPGYGLDGYAHYLLFELDDARKIEEMNRAFGYGQFTFEKYSFELAFGSTEVDEFWKS